MSRAERPPTPRRAVRLPFRRGGSAFTLIEVLIATFILLLMALMFAAVVPIATRGIHYSRSYNQGVLIAQRMVDTVQEKQYGVMSQDTLPTDLVDNGGAKTGVTTDGYDVYPFTVVQEVKKVLGPEAVGQIEKKSWGGAGIAGSGSLLGVRIRLTWREGGKQVQSEYVIATVVTKMPMHN